MLNYAFSFTGGRYAPTDAQRKWMRDKFAALMREGFKELHHGDCVGKDALAHELGVEFGFVIVVHPPVNPALRAWCRPIVGTVLEPKPYLERDRDMVRVTSLLVAVPDKPESQARRSGTWFTVRFARAKTRRVDICEEW